MTQIQDLLKRLRNFGNGTRADETSDRLLECDLDYQHGHFGPTVWCRTWAEWQATMHTDRPALVYLLMDTPDGSRVTRTYRPDELRDIPVRDSGPFARLKYYRSHPGWSVAVSFPLEASRLLAAD